MTDFLAELREELLDGLDRHERAPRSRRGGARRAIPPAARRAVAAVAAAAAAVAGVAVLSDRSAEIQQRPVPQVSRLEGFHASGFVAGDGSLWVSEYDLGHVLRIDPQTGAVRARINVTGSPGTLITATGALWVHDWERGRLIQVDPRTNRVAKTVRLGQINGDVAFAAGALWTVGDRMVLQRLDPDTARVTKRIPLGGTATIPTDVPLLTVAGDTLWVAAGDGGAVTEVDARTGRILGRARGPALPAEIARRTAADASGLWISSPTRRELIHIDAHKRRVTRIPLDATPGPIAIVDGRIWVGTFHETGAVTRMTVLDNRGQIDTTFPVPHPARIIVPTPGGAWVTFGENDTMTPAALRIPSP